MPVPLPAVETAADVAAALGMVAAAVAAGTVTPEEAEGVVRVLDAKHRAIETVALEERVAALEAAGGAVR